VVNLASRIEQLNKDFGSKILVSEDVWKELKDHKGQELGTVTVKGRDEAVRIFKLA
jgi:adenylate cyclase